MSDNKDNTEVLSYKIDTTEFDKGMDKLIAALEKVEKREYLTKLQSSIDGISDGVSTMSFSNMEQGLMAVEQRFSTMGVIGMSVLNNLTNAVIAFAQEFIFDKILGDAINGFQELNIQINSTQTILSNTASRFGTTLADVNKGLDSLNEYADKTIYNFSNMTQAVGAFTSAGIGLESSIQAIKGVANMAAYAGAGAEAASSGMYQFSNALNLGYMMLYQWRSLMYSGLGTKALEDEMISSARGLGIEIDAIIKEYGSFQYSLESGWASKELVMHTLAKFSGEVTEEQLRAMKYTEEEIKRILELGKAATDAATKVVSYEKLVTSLNEAVGSGWARTFRLIIGDFEEGKKLFTMISDNLLKVIDRGAENRNRLVTDWAKFGGRDVVVETIDKLLKMYSTLLITIGQAVNQVFPPLTGEQLANATKEVGRFIDKLMPTAKGLENIGKIVRGFMATIDIPIQFFKALGRYLYELIAPLLHFKTAWIDSAVGFSEFITKLRDEIVKGDLFYKKITEWGNSFKIFIDKIKKFLDDVGKLDAVKKMREIFDSIMLKMGIKDPGFITKFLADAQKSFATFFASFDKTSALEKINKFIESLISFGKGVYKFFEPAILYVIELVGNFAKAFGSAFKDLSTNLTWDNVKEVLGLLTKFLTFGTVAKVLERLGYAGEIFATLGMGFAKTIGYIGTSIRQFANSNDADTLLSISIAIGILAASVFMLSTLPQGDIDKGMKAIAAIYAGLSVSLITLNAILNGPDTFKNMAAATLKLALLPPVLISLAVAVGLMGIALAKLGELPVKQLVKGFAAIAAILGALQIFMIVDKKFGGMTLTSGLNMIAMAVSLTILAKAISMFADIKWETMGKAAAAVGSLLLIMGLMSKAKLIGPQMLVLAQSIIAISASVAILGLAFKFLGSLDFNTIALGLTNVLVMLGAIYFASFVGSKMQARAILKLAAVAVAVAGLGVAFGIISLIDPAKVVLASAAIAAGIGVLYLVVSQIKPTITAGVLGLLQLSGGIAAFAVALLMFKNVDFTKVMWGGVALGVFVAALIGLGALAASFPLIVAGVVAISGILVAASGAFMLFGAGVFFVGAGFKLLAEGLVLLAEGGSKMIDSFIRNIPKFGEAILKLFIMLTKAVVMIAPMITTIGTTIMIALSKSVIEATPWVASAFATVFIAVYDFLDKTGESLYSILGNWFIRVLTDLAENIGTYVTLWNNIQINFYNAMAATNGPVIEAMYNYIIATISALADAIEKDGSKLRAQLFRLATAILMFFLEGIVEAAYLVDGGVKYVIGYTISNFGKVIDNRWKDFTQIGINVISGIIAGILDPYALTGLDNSIQTIVYMMLGNLKRYLDEHSPSKKAYQISDYYMQGLINGLDPSALKSKMSTIKDAMLSFMDGSLATDLNFQPTLSPVLDMSAMSAIERTIASAFGAKQFSLGMSPGFSLVGSSPLNLGSTGTNLEQTVYNQYNTSASPLSVEEVARRTASLIGQNRRR